MKATFKTIFFSVLICFAIFSCKKEDLDKDVSKPIINFSSPDELDSYHYQDTVFVKCKAEDNIELKEFSIHVENIISHTQILDLHPSTSGNTSAIDTLFIVSDSTHAMYEVRSTAIDGAGNKFEKIIYLHTSGH